MAEPLIVVEIFPAFNPWWEPKIKLWRTDSEEAMYHLTAQPWTEVVPFERPLWYEKERSLNPSQAEKLLVLLRKSTSISTEHSIGRGLDGTDYKVSIQQGASIISFSWWSQAPEPWEPVQLLAETALRLVDKEVIAIEETFYREGRTRPQVMSILFSHLNVVETLIEKSRLKQLQGIGDQCRRLAEWFRTYSPSACKQLAREYRRFFNLRYQEYQFSRRGVSPDSAWLEDYHMACRKLNHLFLEVQLVDFE